MEAIFDPDELRQQEPEREPFAVVPLAFDRLHLRANILSSMISTQENAVSQFDSAEVSSTSNYFFKSL
jgi:hypothetical protein